MTWRKVVRTYGWIQIVGAFFGLLYACTGRGDMTSRIMYGTLIGALSPVAIGALSCTLAVAHTAFIERHKKARHVREPR